MIISEKREAAERIAKALDDRGRLVKFEKFGVPFFEAEHSNKRLLVMPAVGHLYTIAPERKGGFDYPIFNVKWTAAFRFTEKARFTEKWIAAISKIAEGASDFISGTDYDIEGEVIGYTILKYACGGKEKTARRMVFSTLTTEELRKSYMEARQNINFKLAEAGETRHIVDFLWGINLSRALTLATMKQLNTNRVSLSAGRVQAPTLKFLVDREKEIQNFVPLPYWAILAKVKIGRQGYNVEYERPQLNNEVDARDIVQKCSQQKGTIDKITLRVSQQSPPAPFDLGTLQKESYRLFGYTPSQTLRVAERLYLGALISYPRTSSQKLPPTINYREILVALGRINKYAALTNKLLANRLVPNEGRGQDLAHPAIYPTGNRPEQRFDLVNERIFDLIVKRFMATFGTPATIEHTQVMITVNGELFYLDGRRILQKGWLEFYKPYAWREEVIFPPISVGQNIFFNDVSYEKRYTSPPPRYNPSSLLKLMEDQNIGTKATRAGIIDTLYARGYVMDEKIVVTELGIKVVENLEKYCQAVISVEFTRALEERMENIEQGKEREQTVLEESIDTLKEILSQFKRNEEQIGADLSNAIRNVTLAKLIIGQCPICKTGKLVVLFSKKTGKRFAGCTNFTQGSCKAAFPLPQPPYKIKLTQTICRTCSWPVITVSARGRSYLNLCLNKN